MKKYYSFPEAQKLLPISYKKLYVWRNAGAFDKFLSTPEKNKFTEAELNRLVNLITPPDNSISLTDLAIKYTMNRSNLYRMLSNAKIKPIVRHQTNKLTPKSDYYSNNQLPEIEEMLLKHRQAHNHYINLEPNTERQYNPKTDYNISKFCRELNGNEFTTQLVYQWINYHRIDGDYSIDNTGKLYFTAEQFQHIKQRYLKVPDDTYGTQKQLAQELDTTAASLINFTDYYGIHSFKVLGIKNVFYSNRDAKKIKAWYHHPENRPYKYHPSWLHQ